MKIAKERPWVNFMTQLWTALHDKHFPPLSGNIYSRLSFCPQKRTTGHCSSAIYSSSTVAILTTETSLWNAHARLLPTLSWRWTVLLSSGTHRKPIM
jgi:hypothetical protein